MFYSTRHHPPQTAANTRFVACVTRERRPHALCEHAQGAEAPVERAHSAGLVRPDLSGHGVRAPEESPAPVCGVRGGAGVVVVYLLPDIYTPQR